MLARLHAVGTRLWVKRDLRHALDEILTGAIELLGADMGAIRILDQGVLKIAAHRGFKQEFLTCASIQHGSHSCAPMQVEVTLIDGLHMGPSRVT